MSEAPLRKFQEAVVEAFYPEALNDPKEFEKALGKILYDLDGDGILILGSGFPRVALERARNFEPRRGDVLIASLPRSGL